MMKGWFITLPSLTVQVSTIDAFRIANQQSPVGIFLGGGEGIRTPDPRVANAVLCQLSYTPDKPTEISNLRFEISKLVAGAGFEPATFGL